jgi:hypothetical protein
MGNKLKFTLVMLTVIIIAVIIAWIYVIKASDDFSEEVPKATYTFNEIMDKTSNDTSGLSRLVDELVAVKGVIKKVTKDSTSTTVELGDSATSSSIICQIDGRHQASCSFLKEGQPVCIKGKIAGFNVDLELGLGNTIQLNYCSLEKK